MEVTRLNVDAVKAKADGEKKAREYRSLTLGVKFTVGEKEIERDYNFAPYLTESEICSFLIAEEARIMIQEGAAPQNDPDVLQEKAIAVMRMLGG